MRYKLPPELIVPNSGCLADDPVRPEGATVPVDVPELAPCETVPGSIGDPVPATEEPPVSIPDATGADASVAKKSSHAAVRRKKGAYQRVTSRAITDWVANNLSTSKATPTTAPCPAAWDLLEWARSSAINKGEFWLKIWAKNLGTKSDLDEEIDRLSDDGRKVFTVIGDLLAAEETEGESVLLYGAEADRGEPEIPEEDPGDSEWESE